MKTKKKFALMVITALLLIPAARVATAGSSGGTLDVSASVTANCTVGDTSLTFGNYDPIVANASTGSDLIVDTTTFSLTCTNGAPVTLGLGLGGNSLSETARQASDGTDLLAYNLFQDAGHSTAWGDATLAKRESTTGTGSAQTITIYAVVPKGQNIPVGDYADSVTITAYF